MKILSEGRKGLIFEVCLDNTALFEKFDQFTYASLFIFLNWKMLLIIPAAWVSNFVHTYEFNDVNGVVFNLRTRGLNNIFYWVAQMIGSIGIGYVLDFSFKSRRMRAFVGFGIVALLGTAILGGGFASQLNYSRDKLPKKLDFKDSGKDFAGPFVLYFSYGLLDAMFQSFVYWVIGALADDSETLSRTKLDLNYSLNPKAVDKTGLESAASSPKAGGFQHPPDAWKRAPRLHKPSDPGDEIQEYEHEGKTTW